MGQFLIVQGATHAAARAVSGKAMAIFKRIHGLEPVDCSTMGGTIVAKFPRLAGSTTPILREGDSQCWCCGVGSWMLSGPEREICKLFSGPIRNQDMKGLLMQSRELDGFFALAMGDGGGENLWLISDRLGRLHVYFTYVGSCAVISTSSMVLAALSGAGWDRTACHEFLGTGSVFEQRSLFQGIEKLEAATVFHFGKGTLHSRSAYWDLPSVMYDRAVKKGTVPELALALEKAFLQCAQGSSRPVMDLTGGMDSRALLGVALRAGYPVETVVNGQAGDPDVVVANGIARQFGFPHRHQAPALDWPLRWWQRAKQALTLCDGECNVFEYARTLEHHSRLAGEFDASINGSGGEICKGYWWELVFPFTGWKDHFDARHLAAGRFATDCTVDKLVHGSVEPLAEHFACVIRRANAGVSRHPNTAQIDNVYLMLRMQRWQGRIASSTNRIWPNHSPFLLREPMEVSLSAPPSVRVRNRMSRQLIEHLNPTLAALPLAGGEPALPLRWNNVHRFWPLAAANWAKVRKRMRYSAQDKTAVSNRARFLWEQEEVLDLAVPKRMLTATLYNDEQLADFMEHAHGPQFGKAVLLQRMLSLELLARNIKISNLAIDQKY